MFVTVRYGDDQSKIFNAYCRNENLLENIRIHCGCSEKDMVEVSDERGTVKNLRNFPGDYGSDFLKERETLVLLTVQHGVSNGDDNSQSDYGDKPVYTPHLAGLLNDREFMDTLNQDTDMDTMDGGFMRRLNSGEGDDDVFNKSSKSTNNNKGKPANQSQVPPGKKSILRKSTKTSLRK